MLGSAVDPFTQQPLTFGAIPGITLLERDAAGYFSNLHFDLNIWGKVLDSYRLPRDPAGMNQLLNNELKILLTPITLKDRNRKPLAVFRMNCHTPFENLTGVYARLRHMAVVHDITPASTRRLSSNPRLQTHGVQARRPTSQDAAIAQPIPSDVA